MNSPHTEDKRKISSLSDLNEANSRVCFPTFDKHRVGWGKKDSKHFIISSTQKKTPGLDRQLHHQTGSGGSGSGEGEGGGAWNQHGRPRGCPFPESLPHNPLLSHQYQQADVNDREHVPQSVIDGNPIRRLISEKTDKVSETPYFNC